MIKLTHRMRGEMQWNNGQFCNSYVLGSVNLFNKKKFGKCFPNIAYCSMLLLSGLDSLRRLCPWVAWNTNQLCLYREHQSWRVTWSRRWLLTPRCTETVYQPICVGDFSYRAIWVILWAYLAVLRPFVRLIQDSTRLLFFCVQDLRQIRRTR